MNILKTVERLFRPELFGGCTIHLRSILTNLRQRWKTISLEQTALNEETREGASNERTEDGRTEFYFKLENGRKVLYMNGKPFSHKAQTKF